MDLVDQIIQIRKERGITQQQLADMTGILQPVIARVESKKSRPTIDFVQKLLDALDLTISLEDSFYCPKEINIIIKDLKRRRDSIGESGDKTYIFGKKYVLKISDNIDRLREEKDKSNWLNKYLLSSKTVKYIEENGKGYLLRNYINGHTLVEKQYLENPYRLISILKEVVNTLRKLDDCACPFKSKENDGTDFVHGDLCLPNIVIDDNDKLIGFLDVSNVGKGDKEYDYSWLLWSFEYNLKTKEYSDLLLKELGIAINPQKFLSYTIPTLIETCFKKEK